MASDLGPTGGEHRRHMGGMAGRQFMLQRLGKFWNVGALNYLNVGTNWNVGSEKKSFINTILSFVKNTSNSKQKNPSISHTRKQKKCSMDQRKSRGVSSSTRGRGRGFRP
jgi:hypothetical protein